MMLRRVTVMAILAIAALTPAQESLKRRQVAGNPNAVLTMAECADAFGRVETILFRLAKVNPTLPRMAAGVAPARRVDIVARMDRIFETLRPKFVFTPKPVRFDPKMLALGPTHPQRSALERLIKWGCVGKVGTLAASRSEAIRLGDFGDALGLFVTRMADVTHRPDTRYSPFLGAGDQ